MEILGIVFTIYLIHVFAWFTPGPLFILVLQNSLSQGLRAGCLNGIGIAIGNCIHMGYATIGILFISGLSENILFYIKYFGSAYLFYLGLKILSGAKKSKRGKLQKEKNNTGFISYILEGFLVNITSPKASIFFVTIFTLFISKTQNIFAISGLILLLSLNSLIMSCALSYFFSRKKIMQLYDSYLQYINIILGTLMILFAVVVICYQ